MTQSRAIWSIALPAMATNVATALIGLADIWVIGRLGDASAQGSVEIGARLLMALLIVFNFLRTATTGLAAQAAGQRDEAGLLAVLLRSCATALVIGGVLLALKPLVAPLGLDLLEAAGDVRAQASRYIGIRYWAAPFWLLNAALAGWLFGTRRVRTVLVVEVAINIIHVALDALLVLIFDMGVDGVATATFTSETAKFMLLAAALRSSVSPAALARAFRDPALRSPAALTALFSVNRDLFLRTLLLMLAMMLLTRQGAQQGAVILAANAILFQMFMLSALLLDAFENAAQVLCGEAVGARDRESFRDTTRAILTRGLAVAGVLAAVFALFGPAIVSTFSTDPAVVAAAAAHSAWLIVIPLAGVTSFVYDGVFIGATWTRAMLVTMAAAAAAYAAAIWLFAPLGNHGLWLSFTLFLIVRAAGQALAIPRLARRTFAPIVSA